MNRKELNLNWQYMNWIIYKSESARSLFGSTFVEHFSNTRDWEYTQFLKNSKFRKTDKISEWELSRYLEII